MAPFITTMEEVFSAHPILQYIIKDPFTMASAVNVALALHPLAPGY